MKEIRKVEDEEADKDFGYKPPPKSKPAPPKKQVREEDKPIKSEQSKKAKWKAQSDAFRNAMKAGSGREPEK